MRDYKTTDSATESRDKGKKMQNKEAKAKKGRGEKKAMQTLTLL